MSSDKASSQPKDYSVYHHVEGIRPSAPWILKDYGDNGVLSAEQLSELGKRFDLAESVVANLSKEIGHCLDLGSHVNLVEVNRGRAIERANMSLENAARLAKRVEQDARKIDDILTPLAATFAADEVDVEILDQTRRKVESVREATCGLYDTIDQLTKSPGAAADMSLLDKRRIGDNRRRLLVETCCYAWLDAERTLTYTTASVRTKGDQRGGRLIELIQAVVEMVTEPPSRLSGETIRTDIDHFKEECAAPDLTSTPPVFGNPGISTS